MVWLGADRWAGAGTHTRACMYERECSVCVCVCVCSGGYASECFFGCMFMCMCVCVCVCACVCVCVPACIYVVAHLDIQVNEQEPYPNVHKLKGASTRTAGLTRHNALRKGKEKRGRCYTASFTGHDALGKGGRKDVVIMVRCVYRLSRGKA